VSAGNIGARVFLKTLILLFALGLVFTIPVLGYSALLLVSISVFLIVFISRLPALDLLSAVPIEGKFVRPPSRGPPAA
jgi:hypothetical protein